MFDCMRRGAIAAVVALSAAGAHAQFVQYTPPGSLAVEQAPTKERLDAAMEEARYRLGPLRVGPWFALKDVGYVNNVFGTTTGQQSDFTATVGVGAHAYLPAGRKLILGLYALPEYVWWRDLADRRGWNGRGGAGLFGYFNRVTLEVQAGASRQQQYPSSEIEVPVNVEDRRGEALLEVRVVGRLSLFGRGSVDRWRYNQRGVVGPLGQELLGLERDETRAGGGVRLHFSERFSVGLGVEQVTNDFTNPERDHSNSGSAPLLEVNFQGAHVRAAVSAVALDLKPEGASQFVAYTGTNGQFQLGWRPGGKVEFVVYGSRNLVYSVFTETPYYIDERTGFSVQAPLGWRSTASAFVEAGRDRYVATPGTGPAPTDDLRGYGATLSFKLGRSVSLVVGGWRTDYTTDLGLYDRSITQVQTTLQFAGGTTQWW